ncbi:hypothetical protein WJX81_002950 [Elliptochloris bilobata]|uniref:Uncharacterized protein n=1 Tax=Elliptochloris bilobata TaxID=381761 RepID=A0AAW1S9J1_9CHLO
MDALDQLDLAVLDTNLLQGGRAEGAISALHGVLRSSQARSGDVVDLTLDVGGCAAAGDTAARSGAGVEPGDADVGNAEVAAEMIASGGASDPLVECSTTTHGIRVHKFAARTWVYPAGVAERAYQLSIIRTALLNNTLVCLPTGLGKTLIAAVVMHNFSRWFPEGKVVFVAPTKPLVSQQVKACYHFMGVPQAALVELTGNTKQEDRQSVWGRPHVRIVFMTPQTFRNDVLVGICPYEVVTCVVVDECHRATGKADVVAAVAHMRKARCQFRVLGLSATPGSSREAIQDVLTNLMISAIEFRSEDDPDLAAYTHAKRIELRTVSPSREVAMARHALLEHFRAVMHDLCAKGAYFGNVDPEMASRFAFLQALKQYRARSAGYNHSVIALFNQAMFLAGLLENLDRWGLDMAQAYIGEKAAEDAGIARMLQSEAHLREFSTRLEQLVRSAASHPKMAALLEVVLEHFQHSADAAAADNLGDPAAAAGAAGAAGHARGSGAAAATAAPVSRVIVFTNLRKSVASICELLAQHAPLITAKVFIGQSGGKAKGGGMPQKEQKAVLADFRAGKFNTLVATCIGEEGLDIPQVDLIVCFDTSKSPIRNIQRMGRTGRHRPGRVVYILASGKEADDYQANLNATQALHEQLRRQAFQLSANPRMLPRARDGSGGAPVDAAGPTRPGVAPSGCCGEGRRGPWRKASKAAQAGCAAGLTCG